VVAFETLRDSITALAALRRAVDKALGQGEWTSASHADGEALAFMALAIANVAAIETLARENVHLVIGATAAGRSAYEGVITCAWMLAPDDVGERDRRWMGLFSEESAYWARMILEATEREDSQVILDALNQEAVRVAAIIDNVKPQFDALGLEPLKKFPTMDERLVQVGQRRNYVLYKTACQFVHPTTRALATVRDLHATHGTDSEFASYHYRTTARDWVAAILLGAEALAFGLETVNSRLRQPAGARSQEVAGLFNAVVATTQAMTLTP
jgi:hypothetical protein